MGWTNTAVTEVVAPNNVPFVPGNNVTGFGTTLPVELSAAGFNNALVFFASDWNPAATTKSIKFRFIAANSAGLQFGFGYCANPSVSQTATVVVVETLSTFDSATGTNAAVTFKNIAGNATYEFLDFGGAPSLFIHDDDGVSVIKLNGLGNESSNIVFGTDPGSMSLTHYKGNAYLQTSAPLLWDTAWSALPLVNGWTGDATRVPLYRIMADGTVQMKGLITNVNNPLNGDQWINALPAVASPLHTWSFLTPTPGRPYNGSQVIEIHSNGTGLIFDMAAAPGVICLDNVRYTSQY